MPRGSMQARAILEYPFVGSGFACMFPNCSHSINTSQGVWDAFGYMLASREAYITEICYNLLRA